MANEAEVTAQATPETATQNVQTEAAKVETQTTTEAAPVEAAKVAPENGGENVKTEEAKPEVKAPVIPEKYELKLPEGSQVDPARLTEIAAEAKAQGLTNEQAQGLLNREHDTVSRLIAQHNAQAQAWIQDATNDKEIGGTPERLKENVELGYRALNRFATPELKQALQDTGFGNHPEVVRVFARIGKAMGEDKFIQSGGNTGGSKSLEEKLYGKKA